MPPTVLVVGMMLSMAATVLIHLRGFDASVIVFVGGAVSSVALAALIWVVCQRQIRDALRAAQVVAQYERGEERWAEVRHHAERALADLSLHRFALDQHALVAVTDAAGVITYVNERFCEISGYTKDELIGKTHSIVNSKHHPKAFWAAVWRTISRGKVWHGEVCNRSKAGNLYWVDTTITPFCDAAGRVTQYVSIRNDITARKAAESNVLEARSRLESVLNSATEVSIIATDANGTITHFSRGAEKMLGYRAEEVIGICTPQFIHLEEEVRRRGAELTDQLGETIEGFDAFVALARRQHTERREWTYVRKDGGLLTVELAVTSLVGAQGEIVGFLGTAIDITERKRADAELRQYTAALEDARLKMEAQACQLEFQADELRRARELAEAANRAKSAFLANMSHEIRTPLTAVLGYAEILRGDVDAPDPSLDRRAVTETICSAGRHLLSLLEDILDLSKIEADKMTTERIAVDLVEILRDVECMLGAKAAARGLQLRITIAGGLPPRIVGDPTRLRQILMNLAGNALKFTETGGVTIHVEAVDGEAGRRLKIEVTDTGAGMSDAEAALLFRPFTQADISVTRKFGGTGLGLTISRRLARLMNGDVRLVATAPGRGTTFAVDLPLEPAVEPQLEKVADVRKMIAARVTQAPQTSLSGHILLAEDGPDNQRLIAFVLRKAGAEVTIAGNGQEALQALDEAIAAGRSFDLILSDLQMPVLDGLSLVTQLRTRGFSLPVLALTADVMPEVRDRCLAAGFNDFCVKPIDRPRLIAVCAQWLEAGAAAVGER
ncbi:MAG: hypothetical protein C0483_09045 [Pirellula sp.]|nr:hypothetical protein [Pirellula sp.]